MTQQSEFITELLSRSGNSTKASTIENVIATDGISYEDEFDELKCIGRGNFGAAFLVKLKNAPQDSEDEVYFIAKKVILGQLNAKEQEGAKLEAELLKKLDHPNIVSYKHSFIEKGILIIIMEFCDHGDLAYHVRKKAKSKGETFTETEIMNWFVQLCLSLEHIHSRKILHRDLKSQNIFLTKYNTIKLGDFGISKVLESTDMRVETVQGTPYYMSPEICQNKPYSYQSDVWALGCVLYELCMLKHAFHAENLLGLVFKIVQDKQAPIPDTYSQGIKDLVSLLLTKDESQRPKVIDILRLPYVKQHMKTFVESQGKININKNLSKKRQIQPIQAEKSNVEQKPLTHKEKMMKAREAKRIQEFEMMKQAAAENAQQNLVSKQKHYDQFYSSTQKSSASSGIPGAHQIGSMSGTVIYQGKIYDQTTGKAIGLAPPQMGVNPNTLNAAQFHQQQQMGHPLPQQPNTHYDGFHGYNKDAEAHREVPVGNNPYDMIGQANNFVDTKKSYLQKPQFVNMNDDLGASLNGNSKLVTGPPQQQDAGPSSMSSDMFMVNDRSMGQSQFAVPNGSAASSQFAVNDRSAGSSQFGVNDRSGASQFQIGPNSNASSQFQVNERSAGSDMFAVNDRSGASQFQIGGANSMASNQFEVNDRSIGSAQLDLSQSQMKSIGATNFQVQLANQQAAQPDPYDAYRAQIQSIGGGTLTQQQVDFNLSVSAQQQMPQMQQIPQQQANPYAQAQEDRPLTGTGAYNLAEKFEAKVQLSDKDDEEDYSDDFYSDEFETEQDDNQQQEYDDREDDEFEFDETVQQNQGLQNVVDYYQKYLSTAHQTEDSDLRVDDSLPNHMAQLEINPSHSFVAQQQQVQDLYGADTQIYKTLNPTPSQQMIKPQADRHRESKAYIEERMGSQLFNQLYDMIEQEIQADTDPAELQKQIKEVCGGNKDLIKFCQKLEEIIFWEQTYSYD